MIGFDVLFLYYMIIKVYLFSHIFIVVMGLYVT
jgi:hypothetical protein